LHGGVPVGGAGKGLRLNFLFRLEENLHRFWSVISSLSVKSESDPIYSDL